MNINAIESKEQAETVFNELCQKWKTLLEFFEQPEDDSSKPILERVKTYADIERISGTVLTKRDGETADEFAYRQVKLIAQVYNEGTQLDPMDTNQYKYYPWHKIDKNSGSGLSSDDFGSWSTTSAVGVRLCFKSAEFAIDAGTKFIDIYSQLKIK